MVRVLGFALLLFASSAVFATPADDLKALIEAGKMNEAYELGRGEPDNLGDPAFDFYFGIAAIEAGSPGEGVLALERYTLQYPDNRNARFNLARGYFVLGEDERAFDEFSALRADATGEQAINIDRFLEAIHARQSRYQQIVTGYIEGGVGYDSNLNAGVSSGSLVNIPGLIASPQTPNSVSTQTGDAFYALSGGAQITRPVAPGIALFGSANVDSRTYARSQNDVFDQIDYGVSGGATYLWGTDLLRGTFSMGQELIDQQNYVLVSALALGWVHQADQFNRYSLDVSIGRQNFDDIKVFSTLNKTGPQVFSGSNLETNNFATISGSWTRSLTLPWNPNVAVTAGYTHENDLEDRPDYSRDVYTVRGQVSFAPMPRISVTLGTTYFYDNFLGPYAELSTAKRHDSNVGIDATMIYHITREWSGRLEVNYNNENSNVGLFDYDRTAVAVKMRYDFN